MTDNLWDEQTCKHKYISNNSLSLRELSQISQVPQRTLEWWSSKGGWPAERKEFNKQVCSIALEEIAQKKAKILANLQTDYFQTLASAKNVIKTGIELEEKNIIKAEDPQKAWNKLDANKLKVAIYCYSQIIEKECKLNGLQYFTDINSAIELLLSEGYNVIPPTAKINNNV